MDRMGEGVTVSMGQLANDQAAPLDNRHTFGQEGVSSNIFCNLLLRGVCMSPKPDQDDTPAVKLHSRLQVRSTRYLRAVFFLFNIQSLFMCAVSVVAVYVTGPTVLNIRFRFDFTIITFGTVTPLMYLIKMAWDRRERALLCISALKAAVMGLYFCHRDWDISVAGVSERNSLGDNNSPGAVMIRNLLLDFSTAVRRFLLHPSIYESVAEMRLMTKRRDVLNVLAMWRHELGGSKAPRNFTQRLTQLEHARASHQLLMDCYDTLSQISVANEMLTAKAGYSKAGEGGMSRVSEYLRQLIVNLEMLRTIRDYHTPVMLRYTVIILIGLCSIIVAPYFNTNCIPQWTDDGHAASTCPAGYLSSLIFVLILMTLYNVQADLEKPFLQFSMDDVFFELPHEFADIVRMLRHRQHAQHVVADRTISGWTVGAPSLPLPAGPLSPPATHSATLASPHHVSIDMARVTSLASKQA